MRTKHAPWLIGLAAITGPLYVACGTAYDDIYVPLTDPKLATTSSSSSSGMGGGGGDGGVDCSGDPAVANTLEECAVFVQADATGAIEDGTRSRPYKTLQKAIDNAQGRRLYACNTGAFAESVTINAPLELWGGFDCSKDWAWSADARSTLNGPADAIALTLASGAEGALIAGFAINAANATVKGGSSIAVAIDNIHATLLRCEISAGDGMAGDDGVTSSTPPDKGADAPPPDPATMNACINPLSVNGGAPGVTTCDGANTSGGIGGKGGVTGTNNGDGEKGGDGSPTSMTNGLGGTGQTTAAGTCQKGTDGLPGEPGAEGSGGTGANDMLSISGIMNTDMTDGATGKPGQGGGGGGGAKSGSFCPPVGMPVDGPAASGGGGGAGGCGGKGGGGGKAGGSSIVILSLGNTLVITDVTLKVGAGGKGGNGAIGQSGGAFGNGANGGAASGIAGSKIGCAGGDGGSGGDGGPGGGGRGGHAIGIAFAKPPSSTPMFKGFTPGSPGAGGAQGPTAPMSSMGATGNAAVCWDFMANTACP